MKSFFTRIGWKNMVRAIFVLLLSSAIFAIHFADAQLAPTTPAATEAEFQRQYDLVVSKSQEVDALLAQIPPKSAEAKKIAQEVEKAYFEVDRIGKELIQDLGLSAGSALANNITNQITDAEDITRTTKRNAGLSRVSSATSDESTFNIGRLISTFVSWFTPFIAILVNFVVKLMGPEAIYGSFGMSEGKEFEDILYQVWVIIRDICNYGFILILMVMAFMTIFQSATPDNNNFELKKVLPKFIVAVVAINMTWFAAGVIIDAANVATNVVLKIPQSLSGTLGQYNNSRPCENTPDSTGKYRTEGCIVMATFIGDTEESNDLYFFDSEGNPVDSDGEPRVDGSSKNTKVMEFINDKNNEQYVNSIEYKGKFILIRGNENWPAFKSNPAKSMAYNIFQFENLPLTVRESVGGDIDWEKVTIGAVFSLVFMVVIIIAYAIMVIVLFERIVMCWANIILSPISALLIVVKDLGIDPPGTEEAGIGFGPFVKYAFYPAMMTVPLQLGYILISVGQSFASRQGAATNGEIQVFFTNELIHGVHTVHHLLWYVLGVAVIWLSATKVPEGIAKHSSDLFTKISSGAVNIAKETAGLAQFARIIPVGVDSNGSGQDQRYSFAGLMGATRNIKRNLQARAQAESNSLTPQVNVNISINPKIQSMSNQKAKELVQFLQKSSDTNNGRIDGVTRDFNSSKWQKEFGGDLNDTQVREVFKSLDKKQGLDLGFTGGAKNIATGGSSSLPGTKSSGSDAKSTEGDNKSDQKQEANTAQVSTNTDKQEKVAEAGGSGNEATSEQNEQGGDGKKSE